MSVVGHVSDIPRCPFFVRYRGKSGSDPDIVKPTRLTHTGRGSSPTATQYALMHLPKAEIGGSRCDT